MLPAFINSWMRVSWSASGCLPLARFFSGAGLGEGFSGDMLVLFGSATRVALVLAAAALGLGFA